MSASSGTMMTRADVPPVGLLGTPTRQRIAFLLLCVVWGATWLGLKVGVTYVPPAFFAGTRWTVAGLVLMAVRRAQGHRLFPPLRHLPMLLAVAVPLILMNQAIQLYALSYVGTGLAAVISSGLTPIFLLLFAVKLGQERFRRRQLAAIGLGVVGILLLFGPKALAGRLGLPELIGAAAIMVSTACYCIGSVLARPLMRSLSPAEVSASTNFLGGLMLLVFSALFEPGAAAAAHFNWAWQAWAAWLFLLLPGSLGATIIYFVLVRDWGASRTGTYAFISPVVSVLLGMAVLGETLHMSDIAGMTLMLAGAAAALKLR